MIDTVFGIQVRMSGLCINRYRSIVSRRLSDTQSWASERVPGCQKLQM